MPTPYQPASAPPFPIAPTNPLAIVAFVFGGLGLGLPAVIFGILARRQIDRSGGAEQGRWMATTGLILGIAFTVFYLLISLFMIVAIHSIGS